MGRRKPLSGKMTQSKDHTQGVASLQSPDVLRWLPLSAEQGIEGRKQRNISDMKTVSRKEFWLWSSAHESD